MTYEKLEDFNSVYSAIFYNDWLLFRLLLKFVDISHVPRGSSYLSDTYKLKILNKSYIEELCSILTLNDVWSKGWQDFIM